MDRLIQIILIAGAAQGITLTAVLLTIQKGRKSANILLGTSNFRLETCMCLVDINFKNQPFR